MKHIFTNTALAMVLALLAYLPFSVYKFQPIQDFTNNDKVLSATSDDFGRYVSFGEKKKVTVYETAVFKVFEDKRVEYTDFYTVSNTSNYSKEYEIVVVNSDLNSSFNIVFTNSQSANIIVKPNETVGVSISFEPSITDITTLPFIIIEKVI
jgi:hypothetical protein